MTSLDRDHGGRRVSSVLSMSMSLDGYIAGPTMNATGATYPFGDVRGRWDRRRDGTGQGRRRGPERDGARRVHGATGARGRRARRPHTSATASVAEPARPAARRSTSPWSGARRPYAACSPGTGRENPQLLPLVEGSASAGSGPGRRFVSPERDDQIARRAARGSRGGRPPERADSGGRAQAGRTTSVAR